MAKRTLGTNKVAGLGAVGFTVLSIIFALLTAIFLANMLGSSKYDNTPTEKIVVAAKEISPSEILTKDHLKEVSWPITAIPSGSFKSIDELFSKDSKPRVPITKIYEKEPILSQKLSDPSRGTGLASLITKELRAYPLSIDPRITQAKVVYPTARVDILSTIRRQDTQDMITKLVVQSVEVLSVNGFTEPEELEQNRGKQTSSSNDVITLLVSPEQGEALTLAAREGYIDVMLRNATDPNLTETKGITTPELLITGREAEMAAAKAAAEAKNAPPQSNSPFRNPKISKFKRTEEDPQPQQQQQPSYNWGEQGKKTKTLNLGGGNQ